MFSTVSAKLESKLYYLIWISSVLYSNYQFITSSIKYFNSYIDIYNDFTEELSILARKRDKSDFEWETIIYFVQTVYIWIVIFVFISEIIRVTCLNNIKALQTWTILYACVLIAAKFGFVQVAILSLQPIIFLSSKKYQSKALQWICALACIALISFYKQLHANDSFVEDYLKIDQHKSHLIVLALCWTNLRCLSFTIETITRTINQQYLLDLFSYNFYLPTLFCGPFVLHRKVEKRNKLCEIHSIEQRLLKLAFNLLRCFFWFIFANAALHYVYISAAGFQIEFVRKLDSWTLYGYGYLMGQFFHIKYVVLYGLSLALARFENIDVPTLPRCIGRIHLYSDMWKYFDPGLYEFLVRYIYLPSRRSALLKNYKLISSLLCFGFVYIWHGVENYILIWACLNYLGVSLEHFSGVLYKKYFQYFRYFGVNSTRRIECAAASPLLAVSAISNFYFFAGTDVGNIFFKKLLNDSIFGNFVLIFILYCCCQVSVDLRRHTAYNM